MKYSWGTDNCSSVGCKEDGKEEGKGSGGTERAAEHSYGKVWRRERMWWLDKMARRTL